MNFTPLILVLPLLFKNDSSWLKNVLPRLDLPSFAPLFKILGFDDKTIDFLTSEKFAETLSTLSEKGSDLKTLLPTLLELFSSSRKNREEKKEAASGAGTPEAADVNAAYFTPVKDFIPDDVSESLSAYFN